MIRAFLFGFFLFTLIGFVNAKPIAKVQNTELVKSMMGEFLDHVISLKKFLVSDEEFLDPDNSQTISKHLNGLSQAVKSSEHDPMLNQGNYKFTRKVLEEHVLETERVFRLGNKSYARWMMNSTLGICMGCHTQVPTTERRFAVFVKPDYFTDEADRADFLFATKNFEGARQIYKKLVKNYPANHVSTDNLEKSVRREFLYQLRIQRDYASAYNSLTEFQKNLELPEFLRRYLSDWEHQLSEWKKSGGPDISKLKENDLILFAKQNVSLEKAPKKIESSDPMFISNLIVSGVLFEYLQRNPQSKVTPEVFYWLAVIDRQLSQSMFYSLADMYLKECMLKYPEHSIATKCYDEYEAEVLYRYSGSSGVHVPQEVLSELKNLKKYVDKKGKISLKQRFP